MELFIWSRYSVDDDLRKFTSLSLHDEPRLLPSVSDLLSSSVCDTLLLLDRAANGQNILGRKIAIL